MSIAALHLAWRYTVRHRLQTILLALALALVLALPVSIRLIVQAAEEVLMARAESTPQVVGARGSALDLLLTSLYFKRQSLPTVPAGTVEDLRALKLGSAIPLYLRFHAQGAAIVGTQLDYFSFRHLSLSEGGMMTRLGDCVVGHRLARERGLHPGSSVFSSQEQVFDLAGVYPLKMRVTGVLAPSGTADDEAVFVDVKTAWLIEGLAHGHDDLVQTGPMGGTVLKNESGNIVGNASVRMFNEVTDQNIRSFHFHGDTRAYPLSAVLLLPDNAKAEALLAGRFMKADAPLQLIRPQEEFSSLVKTLFQVERLVIVVIAVLGLGSLGVAALVFALSFRLRKREFATLDDLGVPRHALVWTKVLEIALVTALGGILTVALASLVAWKATDWVGWLIQV